MQAQRLSLVVNRCNPGRVVEAATDALLFPLLASLFGLLRALIDCDLGWLLPQAQITVIYSVVVLLVLILEAL